MPRNTRGFRTINDGQPYQEHEYAKGTNRCEAITKDGYRCCAFRGADQFCGRHRRMAAQEAGNGDR